LLDATEEICATFAPKFLYGCAALAAIAKQRPDLILMDIQLPIMNGYTATSRIKSDLSAVVSHDKARFLSFG
jgi:CheY-like chemotaxis protein